MDPNAGWDNVNVLTNSDGDLEIKNNVHVESENEKFDIKSYIPKRSRDKYLKPIYIISSITVIVLIIIVILTVSMIKSNNDNDSLTNLLPRGLIIHNDKTFWSYNPKNKVSNILFRVNKPMISFDVFSRKMIILSDIDISTVTFPSNKNFNITYENMNSIFEDAKIKPQSVAVDFITGNMYITDEELELLIVVDSQSKNYNILLSNLKKPREVVLDPVQGLMFIYQVLDSILKANMDGTSLTNILSDTEVSGITLDRKAKRIYWIQDIIVIGSSDYDGNNRKFVFADSVTIASLAIFDDHLFWLWPKYGHINATIWSCRLQNDTCEDHMMHKLDAFHNAMQIKASVDQDGNIPNLCKINNGGCQHLCLTVLNGGRSCACNLGWQLNHDRRTCRMITDFMIYLVDNLIKGRILDNTNDTKTTLNDVFWPKKYNVDTVKIKGVIDFDYDLNNDTFYYSDDTNIYQMKLKSKSDETVILQNELYYSIEDLAYDWITGNMYYSLRSRISSRRHYLMMFNINKGSEYKKIIANFVFDSVFGLQACPYALAIYPIKGYLFFTAGENNQRSIQRVTMNGTKISQIYHIPYVHEHRLITIDYDKDKVYWILGTDESFTKIKYADFDGENEKTFTIFSMRMAKTISVYRQWLYISNDTGIWRVHKETGKNFVKILPDTEDNQKSKKIAGTKLMNSAHTFKLDNNPCADNNGGCERFCFAIPKKTCD